MKTSMRMSIIGLAVVVCVALLFLAISAIYAELQFNKHGNLILAGAGFPCIGEMDEHGFVVWEYIIPGIPVRDNPEGSGITFVHRLENGNTIVVDDILNKILEVTKDKKIVWEYGDEAKGEKLHWPTKAYRLPNGDTYIVDSGNNRVIRVSKQRQIVWGYLHNDTLNQISDIYLMNDRIKHIVLSDKAFVSGYFQLDESDKPINYRWFKEELGRYLQFIDDGHVLVGGFAQNLWEFDSLGNVVWQFNLPPVEQIWSGRRVIEPPDIYQFSALKSGNILIEHALVGSLSSNLIEVNRDKKVVKKYDLNRIMKLWHVVFKGRGAGADVYSNSSTFQMIEN